MNNRFIGMVFCLLTGLCGACTQDISIPDFATQKWEEDRQGCKGYREKAANVLINQRNLLIGANEKEIKNLLGKPDRQELQTRGQHYFVYEIKGGSGCPQPEGTRLLRIRFDALNRVSELAVY